MKTSDEARDDCTTTMPPTFREWMVETLGAEQIEDLAEHGADAGWPGLSFTSDLVALYHRYRHEIRAALNEDAEAFGYDSPEALVATLLFSKFCLVDVIQYDELVFLGELPPSINCGSFCCTKNPSSQGPSPDRPSRSAS